jgi:hypothetical protein
MNERCEKCGQEIPEKKPERDMKTAQDALDWVRGTGKFQRGKNVLQ